MAQIIPEGSLTAIYPNPQLHHSLSKLPDSTTAYQKIPINPNECALTYWVKQGKRSILLATLPIDPINSDSSTIETHLRRIPAVFELTQARNALLPPRIQHHAKYLLPIILLLPNVLESKQTIYLKDQGLLAIGDVLLTNALEKILQHHLGIASSDKVRHFIHTHFCPESILSYDHDQTLNNEQEKSLKSDINNLPLRDGQTHNKILLLGVAGSGKSTVLIKRAALLHQLNPTARLLILTHNKAISNTLHQCIIDLTGKSKRIHCHPFLEWCRKLLGGTWQFIHDDQALEIFNIMIDRHFPNKEINRHSLIREFNFVKNHALTSELGYLNTLSLKHSYTLSNPLRKRIWQACIEVDAYLKERQYYLWSNIPGMLLTELEDGKVIAPYTHVLIDEAHYFFPAWIKLIQKIMTKNSQLFLTADSAHSLSTRRFNWEEAGIEFKGNTINLNRTYRCNKAICKVADSFRLARNLQVLKKPLSTRHRPELFKHDTQPKLLQFAHIKDQKHYLFREVHQRITQGMSPNEILILCVSKKESRLLTQELRQTINIPAHAITGSMMMNSDSIRLCDMASATGLQSKVVFIIGLEILLTRENNASAHDRRSLRSEHTQLIHMAMTRASEHLYLMITTTEVPEELQIDGLITSLHSANQQSATTYLNPKALPQ